MSQGKPSTQFFIYLFNGDMKKKKTIILN